MSTPTHQQRRISVVVFPAWISLVLGAIVLLDIRLTAASYLTANANTHHNGLAATSEIRRSPPVTTTTTTPSSGAESASGYGHHPPDSLLVAELRAPQCRELCLEKFSIDETTCLQSAECSFCWTRCQPSATVTSASASADVARADARMDSIRLRVVSMVRDGALTRVEVVWPSSSSSANTPSQCLVTWEIAGGGLMGNLLTDTQDVQLTLWPDSRYRLQVTCKNKVTHVMSKSPSLTIDTSAAILRQFHPIFTSSFQSPSPTANPSTNSVTPTELPPTSIALNTSISSIHPSQTEAAHRPTATTPPPPADHRVLFAHHRRQSHVQQPSDPDKETTTSELGVQTTPNPITTSITTNTTTVPATTRSSLLAIAASCALMMLIVYCMLPCSNVHQRHTKSAISMMVAQAEANDKRQITTTSSAKMHLLMVGCKCCYGRRAVEGISRVDIYVGAVEVGKTGGGGGCGADATTLLDTDSSRTPLGQIIHL